ncbi:MAG: SBBP repeat-containing protein, partial [Candidatus Hermodarchaeota archaeon]
MDKLKTILVKKRTLILNKTTGLSVLILGGLLFGIILAGNMLNPEITGISSQLEEYGLSINYSKNISSEQLEIKHTFSTGSSTVKTRQSYNTINDFGRSVTVDNEGNMILVGDTMSNLFPTLNAYDKTLNGTSDAFVAKFNALGDLLWSTFLGGKFGEEAWDVAIDSQNNVYVTGYTESFDFPGINAYDDYYNGGSRDVFVTKFDPNGNLIWSTFLGGNNAEKGYGIAIDSSDNVLITGETFSSNFITYNAYNSSFLGYSDSFLTKLSVNGSLMWSTFVGTEAIDKCNDIAIDSQDNIFITGYTIRRISWRVSVQSVCIFKFNSTGSSLWTLFLDGDEDEEGRSIAIDSQNNILITGITKSSNFPTLNGSSINIQGTDIFVVKLQNSDGLLLWASFFGGNSDDVSSQILVDSTDNIIITGSTKSATFPIQNTDNNLGGAEDGFIIKFSSTTNSLLWST